MPHGGSGEPVDSALAAIRRRKEVVAFAIGVTLFAAAAAFPRRVPAEGSPPEPVGLGRQPAEAALAAKAGAAVAARLARERSDLQRLIPTVRDAAYRQVYEAELRRLTGAAEALRTRPATVFALVVHGSNDALARLAKLHGVRLVDIADAPGAAGVAGPAFAILPDATRTTSFGR